MAISGTTTDYTGRLIDVHISGNLNPLSSATQNVSYSFGAPMSSSNTTQVTKYIAGVQKLVQRYVISLMNTDLPMQLQGSVNSNIQAATHIFNLASIGVVQAFKAYQNQTIGIPLDEQLAAVQLASVSSVDDTISFNANLVTNAGASVQFVLPLPLT